MFLNHVKYKQLIKQTTKRRKKMKVTIKCYKFDDENQESEVFDEREVNNSNRKEVQKIFTILRGLNTSNAPNVFVIEPKDFCWKPED